MRSPALTRKRHGSDRSRKGAEGSAEGRLSLRVSGFEATCLWAGYPKMAATLTCPLMPTQTCHVFPLGFEDHLARMSHSGGGVATKRSSSRRRRRVKIRKLSRGPSSAVLLAVLAPGVPICGQWKDTPFPRLVVQRNRSRYFLPLSSAELQLATVGAPGGIAPGKDSPSTATPRLCVR
jgi:hypothetical protein